MWHLRTHHANSAAGNKMGLVERLPFIRKDGREALTGEAQASH
jgi:hypothetical protein